MRRFHVASNTSSHVSDPQRSTGGGWVIQLYLGCGPSPRMPVTMRIMIGCSINLHLPLLIGPHTHTSYTPKWQRKKQNGKDSFNNGQQKNISMKKAGFWCAHFGIRGCFFFLQAKKNNGGGGSSGKHLGPGAKHVSNFTRKVPWRRSQGAFRKFHWVPSFGVKMGEKTTGKLT